MPPPKPFDPTTLIDCQKVLEILSRQLPQVPTRQTVWNWMRNGIKSGPDTRLRLQSLTRLSRHYTTRKWLDEFLRAYEEVTHDIPGPLNRNNRKR